AAWLWRLWRDDDDDGVMKEMRWMSWWCGHRGDGVDVAVVVMMTEMVRRGGSGRSEWRW
ncbi:hypothetical protein Tco_0306028, partial [Tanacetum coccineum]